MKKIVYVVIIGLLIILNIYSFYKINKDKTPNVDLCFYENDQKYILIEKNILASSITSYLYKDNNDNYLSKIYYNDSEEEIEINDLIKEEKEEEYNNKINELLSLKYPKFIVEGLNKEDVTRSYLLRDNELVIYFNNYYFEPNVEELLYLKVNYNEIKDYINFTVLLDKEYSNESGYNYTNSKKSVAITFDDSPNKNKTNKILSYLNDNLMHATFFVVGERTINNEDLLLSIKNNGNEIGSHTYSHQNMKKMSSEEIINDYNKMNNIYRNLFNEDIKLIRPPYGSILKNQVNSISASFILWSLDTNDWRYKNSDYLVNYVINNIKDGDIILFHDSYDSTIKAIEELLPILYSKGYQVMSVSELFNLKGKVLLNNEIYYKAV